MKLNELRQLIEQAIAESTQVNEGEKHQTDKSFRPVSSAVMRLFGDDPLLRELSTHAINQVLAIIYEDLRRSK